MEGSNPVAHVSSLMTRGVVSEKSAAVSVSTCLNTVCEGQYRSLSDRRVVVGPRRLRDDNFRDVLKRPDELLGDL